MENPEQEVPAANNAPENLNGSGRQGEGERGDKGNKKKKKKDSKSSKSLSLIHI